MLTRETVIGLAVVGATLSMAGSWLKTRGASGAGRWLIWAGYICTGISITIFIAIGFRGLRTG